MASSSSKESPVENQMESVMQLMSKRMRGEVTNAEIEAAVSGILTTMGAPPASASTSNTAQNSNTNSNANSNSNANPPPSQDTNSSSHIQVDTGNYDGDQDDADADADAQLKQTVTKETIEPVVVAVGSKKNNKSKKKTEQVEDSSYQDKIDRIPMGKVGAKMMTTFGDGPTPDTRAIEAALLGTRMTLQMAILDARAIRRRAKQTFEQARQTVVQRNKSSVADAADPNMLYRALSGYDRLSLQPKCGFDMEQLTWLFPEEMRAYQRWNVMHSEYQKSAEEDEQNAANGGGPAGVVQEPDTEDNNTREDDDYDDTQALGGHLKERAAQFDARTERMKSEWYIQFAKVRQGSFLLKGLRHRKSKVEVEWEANRKSIRGRRPGWESMPASSVRFLHWVGFEPPTIHPPNEETTQALAFMGYDIMGKILEKAIFIRNLERLQQNKKDYDETKVLWELKRGEQLTLQDIQKALADPDIKPAPLHSLDDSSQPPSQLYFGPGFEQRLELEMEELVAAEKNARITDEERRIRQDEADLFAKLAPPPVILDSLTYLMEQRKEGEREKEKEEREKEEEEQEKEADEEGTTAKPSRKRARLEG